MYKNGKYIGYVVYLLLLAVGINLGAAETLRPPSVPLVACDPYFSIWSPADKLTDTDTVHWTGKPNRITSLVRIDDKSFRLLGKEPGDVPALNQTGVEVLPTRTICTFEGQGVQLKVTFMTPALSDDLMICSRPVTYVTWQAQAVDGKKHNISVYFDASAELTVNTGSQTTTASVDAKSGVSTIKIGSKDQLVLAKRGDDVRIDWGYLFISAKNVKSAVIESLGAQRAAFSGSKNKVKTGEGSSQRGCMVLDLGAVADKPVSQWLVLAYDDEYSVQYFKKNLRPFWRRNGDDAAALLQKSLNEYEALKTRCENFDAELMADLTKAGGVKYAQISALAYRQCLAASKIVADANGQPLFFPKENFSNGCMGTVDVIYPMAPQLLFTSPTLTKAMLLPILDYASSPRWRWPFAPHDLGVYPLANGQVYGGGERTVDNQMPVEETGNMILLLAALAQIEGNADFSAKYWPTLEKWAAYLKDKGFDPENQLCTDDFAGHLAHNVNLSAKAICGLAAFGQLAEARGDKALADEYNKIAHEYAANWIKESSKGEVSPLAFDRPGTWSQKYNVVWDRILGLNLFPDSLLRNEMDFYKKHLNTFGLPLDSRKDYTKLDWTIWTATLTQNAGDFAALVDPVYRFLNESPSRVPMTDWYDTKTARQVGFQARSVVGGVYIQMLYDKAVWKKWASRDTTRAANWAPIPEVTKYQTLMPAADQQSSSWRYTTTQPAADWAMPGFNSSAWSEGKSGFGHSIRDRKLIGTDWTTDDIWLRKEVELTDANWDKVEGWIGHDDDAEVYINGVLAINLPGATGNYESYPLSAAAKATLKAGKNTIAVHCRNTGGEQFIDFGLVELKN